MNCYVQMKKVYMMNIKKESKLSKPVPTIRKEQRQESNYEIYHHCQAYIYQSFL